MISVLKVFLVLFFFGSTVSYAQQITVISEYLPPFEYLDEEGQPTGINVDLARLVFDRMGVDAEFIIRREGDRALTRAQNGEVDLILSVSYVPEREEFLVYPANFSQGQNQMWVSEYVFFSRTEMRDEYTPLTNLEAIKYAGLSVGIIEGVSYEPELWEADLNLVKSSDERANFERLLAGEIDLILTDRTLGDMYARRMGVRDDLAILPQSYFSKPYTIAISKGSSIEDKEAFLEAFFTELDDLRLRGMARTIFLQHMRR